MRRLRSQWQSISRAPWVGYVVALAAVALTSGVIGVVLSHQRIGNISMLYLITVLAMAVTFGRGPAILVAVSAFFTFNWFFIEPRHALTVADPAEWVALVLLLLTAGITGQLASGQRQRAQQARQREREAVVLYDVSRLMSEPDLDWALKAVAEQLRKELQLAAVAMELSDGAHLTARAAVGEEDALRLVQHAATTSLQVLGAGKAPGAARRGVRGRWIRVVPPHPPGARQAVEADQLRVVPVKAQDRRLGELFLVRHADAPPFTVADDRLLSMVATQLSMAIERARLQREATEAETLRRTGELKTALLHAVSHELRTPLASIIASAGSLRQRSVAWTEQARQEFAAVIEEEAQRLNHIVGNLLERSRIEAGILQPEKAWYDLGALVDDVLGRLRPATAQHHLSSAIPEDLPPVPLDYVAIDQVLSNLIENASKYAPPGSEIRIAVRYTAAEVEVEVADRGPGVLPAALPHLFEPFYRASDQGPRPHGSGLGLAVAKGLVEAHGGRIWAENRQGGGARFVFTLPLAVAEGGGAAGGGGAA